MDQTGTGMGGKVCLITGATSGIGLVAARELARRGASVALVGRNPAKTEAVVARIQAETGATTVNSLVADLSSQGQIRDLAKPFCERYSRLDVLINNAGGMWLRRELTVDGLEMTFAVNHLAYFHLTHLLLDKLKTSAPARIVNVSSEAHRKATLDFNDLGGEQCYRGWRQYCRSKLMNLLFTYDLARRLAGTGVTVNALHPGWVATGFAGNNGWRGRLWQLIANRFAISSEKGAGTITYLASAPEVSEISGCYFIKNQIVPSSSASQDEAEAAMPLPLRGRSSAGPSPETGPYAWPWPGMTQDRICRSLAARTIS